MIAQTEYQQRRNALMQQMAPNSIAIICTKPEYPRTQDCAYLFRPDNNFYYLTGFSEPEAIAVLIPGRAAGEYVLFNRKRDPAKEIWDGYRAGQQGAITTFLADQAHAIDDFDDIMPTLLRGKTKLYYQFGHESGIEDDIAHWQEALRKNLRQGVAAIDEASNVSALINEMRLIKSPAEIDVLRKAAAINVAAHQRGMQHCQAGLTEQQLCSEMVYVYGQNNCATFSYEPIVAGGANACTLHYRAGKTVLKDRDLVLVDMGEEHEWYASDITRTYPVNGKFSPEQKAVYELVLSVQLAILDMIKPGIDFNAPQLATIRLLTEGLVTLGLLSGNVDTLIENKAYVDFYPHRVSHWMGLDVHDVSNYKVNGEWRTLKAGMVLTVEPGIYIQPDNQNVEPKWRGIGVRIEDDIVVTATGCENLTGKLAKTVAEIEAVMAG